MSFMYNPFPYDDPRAVNRPALPKKTVGAVVAGTSKAAAALAGEDLATLCIVSKVTVTTENLEGEKNEDCLIPCTIAVKLSGSVTDASAVSLEKQ